MASINVSAARAELPKLIDAVTRGEEVTLLRHGNPVAVLVRPDRLRNRRVDDVAREAAEVRSLVESARNVSHSGEGGLTPARADELVAHLRASRSKR